MPFLLLSTLRDFLELFGTPRWSLIEFHQASTHFPIGLLLAAALFDFGSIIMRKAALRDAAFWVQMLGTLALLVTLAAGYFGNPYSGASDGAQKASWHQNLAFVTTALFSLLAMWRLARRTKITRVETGIYALVNLVAATAISVTGWAGSHIGG